MAAVETPRDLSLQDLSLSSAEQPDISYHPDLEKYTARTKRRLETEVLTKEIPKGFPSKLESTLVWEGKDFQKDEWVVVLTEPEISEIDSSIESFKGIDTR